jgi:ABC-type arginine transport system ATPase subunit
MALTSIKDVDLLIMEKLDDRSLLNLCQTNKNANRICNDENFWKKRSYKNLRDVRKCDNMKWKQYYLYRLSHEIGRKEIIPGIVVTIEIDKNSDYAKQMLEDFKNYTERYNLEIKINEDKERELMTEFISITFDNMEFNLREEGASLAFQNVTHGKLNDENE